MQIKTFKKTDEKEINEFINKVAVLNGGITVTENDITFTYREDKYPTYSKEVQLQNLHAKLYEEKQSLDGKLLDLAYFDTKEVDEKTGVVRRELQKGIELTEKMIEVLEGEIKKLS
jgi:predicted HicB family RNase H-like nuclease